MDKADVDFLVELATRFYVLGQTQARIARDLQVDPATVSRNLKKARDEGIVHIEIRRPRRLEVTLARDLADRFGLKRAVVVANEDGGSAAVASVAADYFGSALTNGARLGLSFGRMLSAMVPLRSPGTVPDLHVSARFFKLRGEPVAVLDDRLIAIEREELARIPTVVAVAAGPEKYAAIRGALRTGYVDVLVTDETTAKELVQPGAEASRWTGVKGGKAG